MPRRISGTLLMLMLIILPGNSMAQDAKTRTDTPAMTVRSSSIVNGNNIPDKFTYNKGRQCSGENYSPSLSWFGLPSGTKFIAIVMHDPDGGNWVHWVQFNIPSSANGIGESKGGPATGIKGVNSFGGIGYAGPCPPDDGKTHRYIFTVFAVDTEIKLPAGASSERLSKEMSGHILGKAELTGTRKN